MPILMYYAKKKKACKTVFFVVQRKNIFKYLFFISNCSAFLMLTEMEWKVNCKSSDKSSVSFVMENQNKFDVTVGNRWRRIPPPWAQKRGGCINYILVLIMSLR